MRRPGLFEGVVLVVGPALGSAIVAATIPGQSLMRCMGGYLVITGLIAGVTVWIHQSGASLYWVWPLLSWTILAGFFAVAGFVAGFDHSVNPLAMTLPTAAIRVRSLLDVIAIAAIFLVLFLVERKSRKTSNRGLFWGVLCPTVLFAVWSMKMAARDYLALWVDDLPEATRYYVAFDLCNAIWLGVILPLTLRVEAGCHALLPPTRRLKLHTTVALASLPLLLGLMMNAASVGFRAAVDVLPAHFWVKKGASVFLWTAMYEEVAYRAFAIPALAQALPLQRTDAKGALVIVLSACAFALAHFPSGVGTVLYAGIVGLALGYLYVRSGSLAMCVASHGLAALFFVRWN